ncbi:MAG: F0F1 ATP synthase subunit A [Acidimicrobiia bacterium]|nr:F0F1 ATP synthase subunit A [Acidimicrobiia bacterium]
MISILAAAGCDPAEEIICAPAEVIELFEFKDALFSIGPLHFTRTVVLIFLAMFIVLAILYFGLRGNRLVPTKFGTAVESLVGFVRNDVAIGIIGPEGARYAPYLLSLFLFIIVGNLFEVTPFINFPLNSRMAIPLFLALTTWVIFVVIGFVKHKHHFLLDIVWPKSVPVALRPLVGLIELVSIFILRPITLAVRLFANMVAGHLMLTLLLASGWVFMSAVGDIGARAIIGVPWFVFGLGIFVFEIVVAILQAYIFTLLSAVYIQTSVHPAH